MNPSCVFAVVLLGAALLCSHEICLEDVTSPVPGVSSKEPTLCTLGTSEADECNWRTHRQTLLSQEHLHNKACVCLRWTLLETCRHIATFGDGLVVVVPA